MSDEFKKAVRQLGNNYLDSNNQEQDNLNFWKDYLSEVDIIRCFDKYDGTTVYRAITMIEQICLRYGMVVKPIKVEHDGGKVEWDYSVVTKVYPQQIKASHNNLKNKELHIFIEDFYQRLLALAKFYHNDSPVKAMFIDYKDKREYYFKLSSNDSAVYNITFTVTKGKPHWYSRRKPEEITQCSVEIYHLN